MPGGPRLICRHVDGRHRRRAGDYRWRSRERGSTATRIATGKARASHILMGYEKLGKDKARPRSRKC